MIFKEFVGRAWIAAILACAAAAAGAQTGNELRFAGDLAVVAKEARARRMPIMIAFTQADCKYCHAAKRDYLIPMQNSADLRDKVIIREVDVDSSATLRDFEGRTITQSEFSKRYQVKRVPTVIVVDDIGKPLASPIVGLMAADFYSLYLQQAIEEGLYSLRSARRQD
ncbi:MAG: thioredoxin family protein [Burkholderiales bacterium]|nr:thioredoxin family protein [Burkholderiales bacterium]